MTEKTSSDTRSAPRLILDLDSGEVAEVCRAAGAPSFRASQVWQWLHVSRVAEWDRMCNIPKEFRARLAGEFLLRSARVEKNQGGESKTRKFLLRLADGNAIELVIIPAARRNTVCVSSQVGCAYRCAFCASGQNGLERNLSCGEIVEEIMVAMDALAGRPDNVVFMGVGEPLDNYDEVLKAIRILNDESGLNIGARRITISTCGIVPGIERLAGEELQVELSVSLHAPDDGLRSRLMPVNKKYPLAKLIQACGSYGRKTGRIVTFEYTLIGGMNDSSEHARALANLLKPLMCRVNLIPLSPVAGFKNTPPAAEACMRFMDVLNRAGINTTMRRSKGGEIDAACGQLRAAVRQGDGN